VYHVTGTTNTEALVRDLEASVERSVKRGRLGEIIKDVVRA
jgi:hypothetical protein